MKEIILCIIVVSLMSRVKCVPKVCSVWVIYVTKKIVEWLLKPL